VKDKLGAPTQDSEQQKIVEQEDEETMFNIHREQEGKKSFKSDSSDDIQREEGETSIFIQKTFPD